ncbi:MAG TPA: UTP--glucose-1-phosphate uridylyltransferase GalU [Chloroflexota bacterium]|nr:UTP--glucose-1-phosphate uridylyltransferase GalU [Chloroflexota bacterium]
MKIRKAVIPAAGLGTRFLPATKAQPKEMLPIVDKPVIQYIVEEAAASGIEQVVIITGQSKRAIEDHFDRSFELEYRLADSGKQKQLEEIKRVSELVNFVYVRQKQPLGNGHAVLCAKDVIGDEPFAVLWGDDIVVADPPCLKQMVDVYDRYGRSVLAAMPVPERDYPKYGMIKTSTQVDERVYRVEDLIEKPSIKESPSNLAQVKAYILTPVIFEFLESTPASKGGEIWLADAIRELLKHEVVYAYEFLGNRYDAGNVLEYLKANVDIALSRPDLREDFVEYLRTVSSSFGLPVEPASPVPIPIDKAAASA